MDNRTPSGAGQSFADLLTSIHATTALTVVTRRDYTSAVSRMLQLCGCSRLEEIPLDLAEFQAQFPLDGFDPALFATEKAYRAWRKKLLAALRGHLGIIAEERARRARDDDWAVLLATASAFVARTPEWHGRTDCRPTNWSPASWPPSPGALPAGGT